MTRTNRSPRTDRSVAARTDVRKQRPAGARISSLLLGFLEDRPHRSHKEDAADPWDEPGEPTEAEIGAPAEPIREEAESDEEAETEAETCPVCEDSTNLIPTGCGAWRHRFCGICLGGWITSMLDSGAAGLIRCPHEGCKGKLPFNTAERVGELLHDPTCGRNFRRYFGTIPHVSAPHSPSRAG